MRIAIDANEAFRPKLTGIGIYARHLVKQLSEILTEDEIYFLGIRSPEMDTSIVKPQALKLLRSPSLRTVWSQIRLPFHLMMGRYDLFHYLEHKLPPLTFCKTVVTIYDLGFIKFPETTYTVNRKRGEWFTQDAIRRASHIIAISQSTKHDICEIYGIHPEKIDAVHLGVDHLLYRPDVLPLKRNNPYIIAVGTLQPRKNYSMLFRAFRKLCDTIKDPLDLLIVGKRGWLWEDIEKDAAQGLYSDRIHLLGYVPDEQMAPLYVGAEFFVMPSLYEGFGIPVLEAMACGKAVISSNVSSLPEIVGNDGILINPNDENQWTNSMCDLLLSHERRSHFAKRALLRSKQFSWERTARETLQVYQKVLQDNKNS